METRRGFLKLLGSLIVTTAAEEVFGKTKEPISKSKYSPEYNILWQSYFPTLKLNEGERFNFYRCSSNKVTVGYGCNVEENSNLLKDVVVFYKGKALTEKGKSVFLNQCKDRTDKELSDYSITKTDAMIMVRNFTYDAIKNLVDIFDDKKNPKNRFFNLPIPMQVLALDVYFNLGRKKFLGYKRLKKALLSNDYTKAVKEAVVHTGKNTTNKERERRKKRLLSITRIIQQNPKQTLVKTQELVAQNYKKETPKLTQILVGAKDKICENAIVCGEFERVQNKMRLAQKKRSTSRQIRV